MLSFLFSIVSFIVCVILMCCGRNYVLFEFGNSLIFIKVWRKYVFLVVIMMLYVSVRLVFVFVVMLFIVVIMGRGMVCRWCINGLNCLLMSWFRFVICLGVILSLERFCFV